MADYLSQSLTRNQKLAVQAAKKRAAMLSVVPERFTAREAIDVWGTKDRPALALLQKMVRYNEIEPLTTYHRPRVYRKCCQSEA